MSFEKIDSIAWEELKDLRRSFLEARGNIENYWKSDALIKAYDFSLARRIGWKWEHVLRGLPSQLCDLNETVVDWGCGSGVASEYFLNYYKPRQLELFDRSSRVLKYAKNKLHELCLDVNIQVIKTFDHLQAGRYGLIVSHVASELSDQSKVELFALVRRAKWFIWVEAGRPFESQLLSELHDDLLDSFRFIAPCPHSASCGMLNKEKKQDWCHFFASPPGEVFQSSYWRKLAKELNLDLRSLPISYLVAHRLPYERDQKDQLRLIGRTRAYKGFARWQACSSEGVIEGDFQKKSSKSTFKRLLDPGEDTLIDRQEILGFDES